MSEPTPVNHPIYNLFPEDVEGFDSLVELALDMRWSCTGRPWEACGTSGMKLLVHGANGTEPERVIPQRHDAAVPLEDAHILW